MEIKLHGDQTGKERHMIIQPLVEKKQLLIILEIGKNDMNNYPELIGKPGRFVNHQTYGSLFRLEKEVVIEIGGSKKEFSELYFADVDLGIVHESLDGIKDEIGIIRETDEENASDNLKSTDEV